jgi:two-component system, cell cycle sensor histidine kinase and response regulator CckA
MEKRLKTNAVDTTPSRAVVLLVEDEAVVREITGQLLVNAGYRVLESSSAAHALELVREYQGRVDLLLTDVVMPEMNGIDLAEQLRKLQPNLITVFMSGYAQSDLVRSIRASSAIHVQKPFTGNFLLSQIEQALTQEQRDREPSYAGS